MPKKEFTSFDAFSVVNEINEKLTEARVNNIYQLDAKTLLFKLHKVNEQPHQLVLEAGRRLHLTSYSQEKPKTPPAFCMSLRKYLSGAWIKCVYQHEFERIVIIQFKTREVALKLVLELFGEGNIVLVGENDAILQALFFKRMRDRNILRNERYQFPPSSAKNPFKITKEEFQTALKASGESEVVRALVRLLGVGGLYAEELLVRANVKKTTACKFLTDMDMDAVFNALQSMLSIISGENLEPNIITDDSGGFVDVTPIMLKRYENYTKQIYPTFNEALDEFFVRMIAAEKAVAGIDVTQVKRESERLKRMIAEQEQALIEDERKMQTAKLIGATIYAHFNELQDLLEKFAATWRAGKDLTKVAKEVAAAGKTGAVPEAFFDSFEGSSLTFFVKVEDLAFGLNLRKSLYENAAEYYDQNKREKQKIIGVNAALETSKKKLTEIEKQLSKVEALKTAAPAEAIENVSSHKVKTKEWFEKFRWFISSEGFLVVAGKDVVSNEVLIKKYSDINDVVFHAEIVGAPFVVIKTESKQPGEATLREAAEFAASFSRAWRESMGSVDVYWVKPEQLSKGGPSGEFVPHGAFAVVGKRSWMRGVPLRLAVGVDVDEEPEFIGGPVDAVKAKTKILVLIVPGDKKGKEFLKQVLRSLTLQMPKEQRENMHKPSIERIREFVPYAQGRMIANN